MKPHARGIQKYTSVALLPAALCECYRLLLNTKSTILCVILEKYDRPVRQTAHRKNTETYKLYSRLHMKSICMIRENYDPSS